MADELLDAGAQPAASAPVREEEPNPFADRLKADPSLGEVSNLERARLDAVESYARGTLLGAGNMPVLQRDASGGQEATDEFGNPIGTVPASPVAAKRLESLREDLARQETMRGFEGPLEGLSALAGTLGGALASPESFINRVPGLTSIVERMAGKVASPVASRIAGAAATQGAVQGAVNPAVQGLENASGMRKGYSGSEVAGAVAGGVLIGGVLHGAGEVVSALVARGAKPADAAADVALMQANDAKRAAEAKNMADLAAEDPSLRSGPAEPAQTAEKYSDPIPEGDTASVTLPEQAVEAPSMDAAAVVADPEAAAAKAAADVPVVPEGLQADLSKAASREATISQGPGFEERAPNANRWDDKITTVQGFEFQNPKALEESAARAARNRAIFDGADPGSAAPLELAPEVRQVLDQVNPDLAPAIEAAIAPAPKRQGLSLVRENFDPSTPPKGPGELDRRAYAIERDGERVGTLVVKVDGNVAEVRDIYGETPGTSDQRNVLGPGAISTLLRQFLTENPQIERLTGERVSGARRGGQHDFAGTGERIEVRLPDVRRGPTANAPAQGETGPRVGLAAQGIDAADAVKKQWRADTPLVDVEDMLAKAPANQQALGDAGREIAAELGVEFKDPGVKAISASAIKEIKGKGWQAARKKKQKGLDRFLSKVGDKKPGTVTDLVRAGFNLTDPAQADEVIARLAQRFEMIDEGWFTTPAGYFDRKTYVRFADGMIGELQLWEPSLLKAKNETGHGLYEAARELPAGPERTALEQQMRDLYEPLLDGLSPAWRDALSGNGGTSPNLAANSSAESLRAKLPTSKLSTGDQAPSSSTNASPALHMDGLPSIEPGTKSLDMGGTSSSAIGSETPAGNGSALIGANVPGIPAHKVSTAAGRTIEVAPTVVEARDLVTSADSGFDQAVQPRQRDRAASQAQIRDIATQLDPERLGYSAEADRGAPIVGPDAMVESGNGRVLALRRVYEQGGEAAGRYRAWLEGQGVDVSGFQEPVLVRQRLTELSPEERGAFGMEANQAATLAMSAAERGLADARLITPEMLDLIRNADDLGALANLEFRKAFVRALPSTEHGSMVAAGGELSSEGLVRIRNAVLARAYGNSGVLARIAEATTDDIKSISNALTAAAPEWAKLRSDIEAGLVRADVDMTPALLEAVTRTADLRGKGQKLDTFLAQQDAFDRVDETVEDWMRMFYDPKGRRAAGAPVMAERLKAYATEARKVSADGGLALGDAPVTARDLTALAAKKGTKNVEQGQSGLQFRREPGSAGADGLQFRRGPGDGAGDAVVEPGGPGARGPGEDLGTASDGGGAGGADGPSEAQLEPLRSLQQQAQDLAEALDVPLRGGRIQGGRSVLGHYDTSQDVVRVRNTADFETVAHEAGHALEKHVGAPLENLIRRHEYELGPLDYEPQRADPSEGFAEWMRHAMVNPAMALQEAPSFQAAFRNMMEREAPELLEGIENAIAAHQAYLQAPTGQKLEAMVRAPEDESIIRSIREDGLPATIGLYLSKAYEKLFDDRAPAARAVRSMVRAMYAQTGERVRLEGADNPENLVRLFSRAQQAAVQDMREGVRPYRGIAPEGPSLADALATATGSPGILGRWNTEAVARFDQYLVARRAELLYRRFDAGGMERRPIALSGDEVRAQVAELEAANPTFREASDQVHEFTRQLLRKQYEGGLIDAELYGRLMEQEFYVPLFRHMDDKPGGALGGGGPDGPGQVDTIKKIGGSDRDIIPPTQGLMTQAFLVNRTLAHNDIIKSFVALARQARAAGATGIGRILEEIPPTQMMGKRFDLAEAVASAARNAGVAKDDLDVLTGSLTDVFGDDPIMATIFRAEPTGKRGEPIVFYKDGGKVRAVRLQSAEEGLGLYETIAGLPPVARDMAIQLGAATSSLLRTGIVTNPTFAITNFIRDQLAVGVLRSDYVPFVSGAKGVVSEIRQDQWAGLYAYGGGVSPGAGSAGLSELIDRDISALARRGWAVQKIGAIADLQHGHVLGPAKAVAETIETAEAGTRLAVMKSVFEAKKHQGLSDYDALIEAASQATDVMDFGRHGSGTLYIRTLVPFMNAHLQGLDKGRRTLIEPLWRAARGDIVTEGDAAALRNAQAGLFKMAGIGGMLGVGYGLYASQHEAYRDANEELRATHLIIPGDAFGRPGKVLVIPKPFELAMGFNLGEALGLHLATGDERAAHFAIKGMREVLQPPNPLTGIPLVKTTAELALNRSFFTGRDIVPENLQNRENPRFEVKPNTSSLAKAIGNTLNISPIKVDYAVGSAFGNWGRDLMAVSNVTDPNAAAAANEDTMFVRRFIKGADRTSETTKLFWDQAAQRNGAFAQAAQRYSSLIDGFQDREASDYLGSLPAAQRAFVILNKGAKEDSDKPAFSADVKRLNPIARGALAVQVVNSFVRELGGNTQRTFEDGSRFAMDPQKRRDVIDAMRVLSAIEQRNAMVLTDQQGYAGRPLLSPEDQFKVIRAMSPEAANELATRYATSKILPTATVARLWPQAQKQLLADGSLADIQDLGIEAKGDGYAFDGEAVRKPQKRRVTITPGVPSIPPAIPARPGGIGEPTRSSPTANPFQ